MRILLFLLLALTFTAASRADEVPRVVALEWSIVEDLLALDLTPAGAADIEGYRDWVGLRSEELRDVAEVGRRQEPSIERIAALDPDLILGVDDRHAPHRDRFSAVAPTMLLQDEPPLGGDALAFTRDYFREIAAAVGREEEARAVLDQLDDTLTDTHQTLAGQGLAGMPVVFAQLMPGVAQFRLFGEGSLPVGVAEAVGLESAWTRMPDSFGFNTVGPEALVEIADDAHLFLIGPEDDPTFQRLSQNPVWQALPFVRQNRVHVLPLDTWFFGGPLSAERIARRVVGALTGA